MTARLRFLVASALSLSFTTVGFADAPAAEPKPAPAPAPAPQPPAKEAADQPAIKQGRDGGKGFLARHEGFLKDKAALENKVDVLLVGDSITDGWRGGGKKVLAEGMGAKHRIYNIGIGGDRTQHVLWRLENGEVADISPKVAMLMIGTNNLGANSNEEIVAGITKIVQSLNAKLPNTKVLLLGVFPRAEKATDKARERIKAINAEIAKLDDGGKRVKYLDIGAKFLDEKGDMPKDVMGDFLHPSTKGYQIWHDAVAPVIEEMMK
jgi:lysophospholipase L1-like esterase